MKITQALVVSLIVIIALSVVAEVRWLFNSRVKCASVPAPNVQHVCHDRVGRLAQALPANLQRMFGIGEIWTRVKCELDSVAASRKSECS